MTLSDLEMLHQTAQFVRWISLHMHAPDLERANSLLQRMYWRDGRVFRKSAMSPIQRREAQRTQFLGTNLFVRPHWLTCSDQIRHVNPFSDERPTMPLDSGEVHHWPKFWDPTYAGMVWRRTTKFRKMAKLRNGKRKPRSPTLRARPQGPNILWPHYVCSYFLT